MLQSMHYERCLSLGGTGILLLGHPGYRKAFGIWIRVSKLYQRYLCYDGGPSVRIKKNERQEVRCSIRYETPFKILSGQKLEASCFWLEVMDHDNKFFDFSHTRKNVHQPWFMVHLRYRVEKSVRINTLITSISVGIAICSQPVLQIIGVYRSNAQTHSVDTSNAFSRWAEKCGDHC